MHDPECVYVAPPEPEPEPIVVEVVEEVVEVVVEEESNGGMIAGIVVGFLVIIGLAVGGFFLWKRRKNRQETEGGDPKVAKVLPTVDGVEMKLNAAETKLGSTKKQDPKIIRQDVEGNVDAETE